MWDRRGLCLTSLVSFSVDEHKRMTAAGDDEPSRYTGCRADDSRCPCGAFPPNSHPHVSPTRDTITIAMHANIIDSKAHVGSMLKGYWLRCCFFYISLATRRAKFPRDMKFNLVFLAALLITLTFIWVFPKLLEKGIQSDAHVSSCVQTGRRSAGPLRLGRR